MDYWIYPVAIIGGFVAGFINTIAGNGSAITLTILMEMMGLPGNVANASNRVGLLAQTGISVWVFNKEGKLKPDRLTWLMVAIMFVGAMGGLWLASTISNEEFKSVFSYLMVMMLFLILVRPKRWLKPSDSANRPSIWFMAPFLLMMGFYGGFIQMGMGLFFVAFAVLIAKYDIIEGNAVKLLCVGTYTVVVLAIFAWQGLVDWKAGGLIAIGQVAGGWTCARFASRHPLAGKIAYYVLVVIVVLAIVRLFFDVI